MWHYIMILPLEIPSDIFIKTNCTLHGSTHLHLQVWVMTGHKTTTALSAHRFIWLGIWHHNAAIETQFPDYAFGVFSILQLDSYRNVSLDYYLAMYWLWKNSCFVTLSLSWAYHELYCSVSYCVILNSCKHFPLNTSILASSVCICMTWWCYEPTGNKQCCAVLVLHFLVFIYFKYSQINEQKCTFFPWLHQFSRTLCSC